jgi:hypothetical protein
MQRTRNAIPPQENLDNSLVVNAIPLIAAYPIVR